MSKLVAMAVIHPDHLLDQARSSRGRAIAPEAWQQLGAHLAACGPCAFEQAVTDDFAREREAGAIDAGHLDRLVEGALARASGDLPPRARRAAVGVGVASAVRWVAAAAVIAAAIGAVVTMGAPGRGARRIPSVATPSEANLDAGAGAPLVGGDS